MNIFTPKSANKEENTSNVVKLTSDQVIELLEKALRTLMNKQYELEDRIKDLEDNQSKAKALLNTIALSGVGKDTTQKTNAVSSQVLAKGDMLTL